jgi:hypothetical protein
MMSNKGVYITCIGCVALLLVNPVRGQEKTFSVVLKGNFTTGSQLFPNPNSRDAFERNQFFPIEDFFGFGAELKYHIPETNIALGLSADYIRTTTLRTILRSPTVLIPEEDGYRVIPVELTGYFHIPVAGPTFGVYMGGGGGAYFGRRIYRFANVEAASVNEGHGFGIHVLGGLTYHFTERFSVEAEMKFRDLQFESSNAFSVSRIAYRTTLITVSTEPFESRVHTDGVLFQVGAAVSF